MKKLFLLALLVIGCSPATTQVVNTFVDADGDRCLYIENRYDDVESGIYCKE